VIEPQLGLETDGAGEAWLPFADIDDGIVGERFETAGGKTRGAAVADMQQVSACADEQQAGAG
jgi:hypothetical protein